MYTEQHIKIVDKPEEFVRLHPEMFLPLGKKDSVLLATRVAEAALFLGSANVTIHRSGHWMIVVSDFDWTELDQRDAFSGILPFPEAGANSCRPEFVIFVFSSCVCFKRANKQFVLVKGDEELESEIQSAMDFDEKTVLAFKL